MTLRLKRKLQSNRGASITFALLLFLVCAVVSSVVLTAGTAAAGRMSEAAETEQRYYNVTSAASILESWIEPKTVTVVKRTITKSDSTSENRYYVSETDDFVPALTDPWIQDNVDGYSQKTLLDGVGLYVFRKWEESKSVPDPGTSPLPDSKYKEYSMNLTGLTDDASVNPIVIKQSTAKDGTMTLVVQDIEQGTGMENNSLTMIFSIASLERTDSGVFPEASGSVYSDATYEDMIKEYRWSLIKVDTGNTLSIGLGG